MTKEEAIRILEYPVSKWSMDWDERDDGLSYYDAIQLAVSALRNQLEPNDPLTLDELREMDGEPVWVEYPGRWSGWHLVKLSLGVFITVYLWTSKGYATFAEAAFADGAIVYRRKPEVLP